MRNASLEYIQTHFCQLRNMLKLLYHPKSSEATSLVLVNTVSFKTEFSENF